MKKHFCLIIFLLFIASFFIFNGPAQAQPIGIKISPVRIEDLVDPGQVFNETIKVKNDSSIAKTLFVYLRDFKAEGESGQPKLIAPGTEKGSYLAAWINITNEGIDFGAREEKEIEFSVAVPANVGPGGYYGAILFGTEPPRIHVDGEDKGAGMAIGQQTGCLLLLRVKGDVLEEARVREFTTDKNIYGTPFDVNFLLRIENVGNVHIKPYGSITVTNMFGKEVGSIRVNEGGSNVLPNSIRRFETAWSGKNGFGRYKADCALTYGTKVDLGGQGMQSLFSEKNFWIIPWNIIIPVLLGLIIILALFILLLRLYRNKAIKKALEQAGLRRTRYVKKYQGPSPAMHFSLILLVVFIILFLLIGSIYLIFFA